MDAPLVSIVIPTYDRPDFLTKTLESIEGQSFSDYEVIVVDDGSPNDDAKGICERFSKVRYFKIENSGGPSKPRNTGIQKARGKYVAFVDDDDLWLPQKLQAQVKVLDANEDIGLVHGCCIVMDKDGIASDVIIGRPGDPSEKTGKVTMKMVGNWTLMTSTVLVRQKVLAKVGFFNEEMPPVGEDTEYWVRCSLHTSFYYQDDPMVFYRKHDGTSSILRKEYIYVPTYLNKAMKRACDEDLLSESQYRLVSKNIVRMQIKKIRHGFFKTLGLLFQLNPFWFLNFGNIKLLIAKIIAP